MPNPTTTQGGGLGGENRGEQSARPSQSPPDRGRDDLRADAPTRGKNTGDEGHGSTGARPPQHESTMRHAEEDEDDVG